MKPTRDNNLLWLSLLCFLASLWLLSGVKARAAELTPLEQKLSYAYKVGDTGSMRPVLWDFDTIRVFPPILRPWVYDREHLLGKKVIRLNLCGCLNVCHVIIAVTPRGAVTKGLNNEWEDPGFMSRDGSDYGGEWMVEIHQAHPGKQKFHSWQRM